MIQLVQAGQEHLPRILRMMEDFYAIDQYPFHRDMQAKNIALFLASPELGRFWLICRGDAIIGYICATFGFSFEYGGKNALIDEFYIEAPYRGQGIGRQSLAFVEAQGRALGLAALHLEVEKHNEKGNQLYISQGFKGKGRLLLTKDISSR